MQKEYLKNFINPFCDSVNAIAKKFDEATFKKNTEDLINLLDEAVKILDSLNAASQAKLYYCMGTAYGDFPGLNDISTEDSIKRQLYYFRMSIKLIECDEYNQLLYKPYIKGFKGVLYTNYANVLEGCGRKIAAIENYKKALSICKDFGMALGNLGVAYQHYGMLEYSEVNRDYFHYFAYDCLKKAIGSKDPNTHEEAKKCFKRNIAIYDNDYVFNVLEPELDIPQYTYEDIEERKYRSWILDRGLFLNTLNDLPVLELCFAIDNIHLPNMIVHIDDKPIYHGMFNQIKQEYVYARYLYYVTQQEMGNVHYADKETYLLNFADYPQYSIRIENLKSSFKTLYGLFDKIAFFINSYFELGIKEQDVSFKSIWWGSYGKGKRKYLYKNRLAPFSNFALSSLYWINKEFFEKFEDSPNPDLKRITDIRNALEHKYVKIVWDFSPSFLDDEIDDLVLYVMESELYDITLQLLKIIREAIICLCLCVNIEECKKMETVGEEKIFMPFEFMEYEDEWKI